MYPPSSSVCRNVGVDAHRRDLNLIETLRGRRKLVLRVESLGKRYGTSEAVAGVSFQVQRGEVFGLLGLNGAGKTTLISMLATQRRPSSGDATVLGHSIRDARRLVRRLIGVATQNAALYPLLTAAENLRFFGRIYDVRGVELDDRVDQLLGFVGLKERRNIADVARSVAYTINERASHLEEFEDVEDTSIDLYAAVRNGFLQRRQKSIDDAIRDRDRSWSLLSHWSLERDDIAAARQPTPDLTLKRHAGGALVSCEQP